MIEESISLLHLGLAFTRVLTTVITKKDVGVADVHAKVAAAQPVPVPAPACDTIAADADADAAPAAPLRVQQQPARRAPSWSGSVGCTASACCLGVSVGPTAATISTAAIRTTTSTTSSNGSAAIQE
jgi:hypothetical protein